MTNRTVRREILHYRTALVNCHYPKNIDGVGGFWSLRSFASGNSQRERHHRRVWTTVEIACFLREKTRLCIAMELANCFWCVRFGRVFASCMYIGEIWLFWSSPSSIETRAEQGFRFETSSRLKHRCPILIRILELLMEIRSWEEAAQHYFEAQWNDIRIDEARFLPLTTFLIIGFSTSISLQSILQDIEISPTYIITHRNPSNLQYRTSISSQPCNKGHRHPYNL